MVLDLEVHGELLEELLSCFRKIEKMVRNEEARFGLCHQIGFICRCRFNPEELLDIAQEVFKAWPHHTGREAYPVPPRLGMRVDEAANAASWEFDNTEPDRFFDLNTEYGRLRRDLLSFSIAHIEGLLK